MKINIRTKALFLGAIISGMLLFAAATAPADTYFQAVNEASGGDWTQPIWTNAATITPVAATNGNDYISAMVNGINFAVRTINTATQVQSFAGDHLLMPARIAR
jgi:hypothetical protein